MAEMTCQQSFNLPSLGQCARGEDMTNGQWVSMFQEVAKGPVDRDNLSCVLPAVLFGHHSLVSSTAMNAFCGMLTLPIDFIFSLPFFWASRSLRLRVTSPP